MNIKNKSWSSKEKLRISGASYDSFDEFDAYSIEHTAKLIIRYRAGNKLLEVGCGEGLMTQYLLNNFEITAIDGREEGIKKVKKRFGKKVKAKTTLFEQFSTKEKFTDIVVAHVLEHVGDPVALLKRTKKWIAHGGKIHIIVPHANSLHRLIASTSRILNKPTDLTSHDKKAGHRRVYLLQALESDIKAAGLKVIYEQGVLVKPLPSPLMLPFGKTIINYFVKLGKYFPKIAGEIYIIATT